MGVDRTDYLMMGVDLGVVFEYEEFEPEFNGAPDKRFDMVCDWMSSGYCIAGKILATSDDEFGFGLVVIKPNDLLSIDYVDMARKISEATGMPVDPNDFKLYLFSHFS